MRWQQIKGFEGLYEINELGQVKSLGREKFVFNRGTKYVQKKKEQMLSPLNKKNVYPHVILYDAKGKPSGFKVHRLVAEAFLPNPLMLPLVNHLDGNKHNFKLSNLEWCDYSHNLKHAYDAGLIKSRYPNAKLKEADVLEIRRLYESGQYTHRKLSKVFGVSRSTIYRNINKISNKRFEEN